MPLSTTNTKRWLLIAGLAIVLVGIVALSWPTAEPMYQGKPLTYWLQGYITPAPAPSGSKLSKLVLPSVQSGPTQKDAEAAIRTMGTNVFPTLLQMISTSHRESLLEFQWHLWAARIRGRRLIDANNEGYVAVMAFQTLRMEAAPAVPQLIEIYKREKNRREEDSDIETRVILVLMQIGSPARQAIPMLLDALSSKNTSLRPTAAVALGSIHAEPAEVVPVLISCLKDPQALVRHSAVQALWQFHSEARAAVPALLDLARDTNRNGPAYSLKPFPSTTTKSPTIGEEATNAVWIIDRNAALKAGIKKDW